MRLCVVGRKGGGGGIGVVVGMGSSYGEGDAIRVLIT